MQRPIQGFPSGSSRWQGQSRSVTAEAWGQRPWIFLCWEAEAPRGQAQRKVQVGVGLWHLQEDLGGWNPEQQGVPGQSPPWPVPLALLRKEGELIYWKREPVRPPPVGLPVNPGNITGGRGPVPGLGCAQAGGDSQGV